MKKLVCLIILLGVIALYACTKISSETEHSEITFSVVEELQGRVVALDSVMFRYPYRLKAYGDRVVIEDLHGPDHYFHLFTYPDYRYLSSFGQRGDGPEEMQTVDDFFWNGQTLWALDNIKAELVRWELNANRDKMVRTERIKLDKTTFRALSVVPFQNDSFLIPNYSGDSRFCQVDRIGKLVKKWGEIPTDRKSDLQKYPYAFGYGWRSFIDYFPKTGILAAATQFGEVLEVWNVQKNTHKVIKGKLGEPEFEIHPEYALPTGMVGHNDIRVTDRAIYAIYRGVSLKDEMLAYQNGKPLPEGGRIIRVFSLEGKPLKQYKLDHSVSGIWVDEQAGKMWALDGNSDEPLVEYRLK